MIMVESSWLHRLGKTDGLSCDVKDGVVLSDEDISKDPELFWATWAKASAAVAVVLWRDKKIITWRLH